MLASGRIVGNLIAQEGSFSMLLEPQEPLRIILQKLLSHWLVRITMKALTLALTPLWTARAQSTAFKKSVVSKCSMGVCFPRYSSTCVLIQCRLTYSASAPGTTLHSEYFDVAQSQPVLWHLHMNNLLFPYMGHTVKFSLPWVRLYLFKHMPFQPWVPMKSDEAGSFVELLSLFYLFF